MHAAGAFVEPGASVADAARIIVETGLEPEVFQECTRAALGG